MTKKEMMYEIVSNTKLHNLSERYVNKVISKVDKENTMKYNIVVRVTDQELRESINNGKEFKVFTDVELEDVERHLMIIDRNGYIEFVRMIPTV